MLAAALFLAALNLRPAVASVSPLLDTIRDADDLSHTAGGLLTTIPTLCMGAGAFLVPPVAARLGAERALTYAMVVIGVATAARIWGGNTTILFATTLAIGAGIALAQPLLPGLVRTYFVKHSMLITALYSLGITLGAAIPAAASPAINDLTNSWEVALAFWAVFAVAAIVVLIPIARRSRPGASARNRDPTVARAPGVADLVVLRRSVGAVLGGPGVAGAGVRGPRLERHEGGAAADAAERSPGGVDDRGDHAGLAYPRPAAGADRVAGDHGRGDGWAWR